MASNEFRIVKRPTFREFLRALAARQGSPTKVVGLLVRLVDEDLARSEGNTLMMFKVD